MTPQPGTQLQRPPALSPGLRSETGIHRLVRDVALDKLGNQVGEAVGREFISGGHDGVDRPPSMLAHEDSLEVVPAADVDVMPFDPDEVKALALPNQLAGGWQREHVLAYPDQRSDLATTQPTLLGEFSRQCRSGRFSSRDAAARSDPKVPRPRLVRERFEEQDAVVPIQDDGADRLPNDGDLLGVTIGRLHQQELSGHNPEASGRRR